MSNKVYRIGEAAKLLGVKTSVLRFWEEEFSQIRPKRTDKGQRYYSEKDMETLMHIRNLLYDEGMTISGAQKTLRKPQDNASDASTYPKDANNKTESTQAGAFTGIIPEFYPHSEQVDNMPTPKVLASGFPDCDHCEESAYLTSINTTMQTELKTQAQYKNNLAEVHTELKKLLDLLSYSPTPSCNKNAKRKHHENDVE